MHLFDFTYRGHEISILDFSSEAGKVKDFACDIRADEFDGDWIGGYHELESQRDAVIKAIDFVDQYIYDQTHFTEGISI